MAEGRARRGAACQVEGSACGKQVEIGRRRDELSVEDAIRRMSAREQAQRLGEKGDK